MNVRAAAEPIGENRDVDDAWRTYGPAALRFATALVGSHDAHDITTNAFLRATRQPADLAGPRIVSHQLDCQIRLVRPERVELPTF